MKAPSERCGNENINWNILPPCGENEEMNTFSLSNIFYSIYIIISILFNIYIIIIINIMIINSIIIIIRLYTWRLQTEHVLLIS